MLRSFIWGVRAREWTQELSRVQGGKKDLKIIAKRCPLRNRYQTPCGISREKEYVLGGVFLGYLNLLMIWKEHGYPSFLSL